MHAKLISSTRNLNNFIETLKENLNCKLNAFYILIYMSKYSNKGLI